MAFFDRILSRRPAAKLQSSAIKAMKMAYDAASISRRSQGWRVVATDANAETLPALSRLRNVARDMVRNNAHAMRGRNVLVDNIIGAGIIPSVENASDSRRRTLEKLLKAHLDTVSIDARGQTNLCGLQAQIMMAVVQDGEVLVRWRRRTLADQLPLPFQLEVLEADYLDSSKDGKLSNGNFAIQGVEFNLIGARVAYWIHTSHPGAAGIGLTSNSVRVPAETVAHVYRIDRPGQVRGVTWFAPVIMKMRDLADFDDAQLLRQKIAACFAAFIHSDEDIATDPGGTPPRSDDAGTQYDVETLEPGMIQRLRPGEEVSFGTPPAMADYEPHKRSQLRDIAAGMGIPYEAFSGDLTGVNFSSGRMGWLDFQRTITATQNRMFLPMFCEPLSRWLLEGANLVAGSATGVSIGWTPPRREMINPKEEIAAARDAIRARLSSVSHEQRKLGFDPEDLDQEIAADNVRADDLGLISDSDPRHRTAQGNAVTTAAGDDAADQDNEPGDQENE